MVPRKTVWCQIYAWYVLSRSIMQFSSRKSWLLGIWYNKPSTSSLYKLAVADSFVLSGVVICAVAQLAPCTWPIVLSAGDELSRWLRLSAIKILLQYFQLLADEEMFVGHIFVDLKVYWNVLCTGNLTLKCGATLPNAPRLLLMSRFQDSLFVSRNVSETQFFLDSGLKCLWFIETCKWLMDILRISL